MFKKSLIAVASLLAAVGTAEACSTLVIGKAVSETGNIIVAHNEDNGGRLFNMQHYVPPAKQIFSARRHVQTPYNVHAGRFARA